MKAAFLIITGYAVFMTFHHVIWPAKAQVGECPESYTIEYHVDFTSLDDVGLSRDEAALRLTLEDIKE